MVRLCFLNVLVLLLSVVSHGVAATWEYSVVCPPAWSSPVPEYSRCDIILVAGDEPATVNITTVSTTHSVTVNREYRWTAENMMVDGGVENKAILISSDVQISVNLDYIDTYWEPQEYNDATGIASVSSAQTSFYIVNHVNAPRTCSMRNDFFAISPFEDNTIVTVTSPLSSFSVTLNLYDTFSEIEDGNNELSGYKINSSLPVTVVAGSVCTSNDDFNSLGTYITSHRPVDNYKTHYIVPSIKAPRNSGYDVHVVASVDNTLVNIDGEETNLDEGEILVQTFALRTNVTIVTCSLPCNVVQFSKGYYHYDGIFEISVIPTNDFYNRAIFTTSEEDWDHHITVVVDSPTAVSDILLDGVLFDPEWSTAGDYIFATADVGEGYHVMNSSESRFAVYAYAHTGRFVGGYGVAVLPAEGELESTTVSPELTTSHPSIPGTSLPQYSITTNGTLMTEDESDVTPACVQPYIAQMDQQAKTMAATIDALIGKEICTNQMPGEVLIKSAFASVIFSGNQAEVYVAYSVDIQQHVRADDVQECAQDIAQYVSEGEHWPDPILPGTDDCPPMELNPDYFQLIASHWICPQTDQSETEVPSDNILLYEIQVGDVMDTEDGSDLSPACTNDYAQELARQALTLASRLQAMMAGGEMCERNHTIVELSPVTLLASIGAQVHYTVTMVTQPGPDTSFGEFLDCAFEVYTYVRTVSNWPDPPLPPQPGCPALTTDTELMEDKGSGWSCVDKN